jgi:hypothetical protein
MRGVIGWCGKLRIICIDLNNEVDEFSDVNQRWLNKSSIFAEETELKGRVKETLMINKR